MLAVKADYFCQISIKKLAAAMKMTMKMNCVVKTVALVVKLALNKNIIICHQRNQYV